MFVLVRDDAVQMISDQLPSSWENVLGVDALTTEEKQGLGWFEVEPIVPSFDAETQQLGDLIVTLNPLAATYAVVAKPVPATVPNANLRVALRELGLLPLVKAKALEAKAAANAIDPSDDGEFWERWEYGNFIGRHDGFVLQMQAAFEKTDAEMNAIFRLAATK